MRETGIYIHIPFCVQKCLYCDFPSFGGQEKEYERYTAALCREIEAKSHLAKDWKIKTVFFGGGTPTVLSAQQMKRILDTVFQCFHVESDAEITTEANPGTLSLEKCVALRQMGFNRLSMGVQSFSDADLAFLRRRHTARGAVEAVELCQATGYDNLSIDLIYGLPGQTLEGWQANLQQAVSLGVPHISAYSLIYEVGTALWRMRERGEVKECDEELSLRMFDELIDRLVAAGYEHYEISNFARDRRYARHNTSYWTGVPYLGLGAAAHSYDGRVRRINPASLRKYVEAVESGRTACDEERESRDSLYNERILTSLRTCWGLDLERLRADFGEERLQYCLEQAQPHLRGGRLAVDNGVMRITRAGIFTSDDVMSDLFWVD